MLTEYKVTENFFTADEFCKFFDLMTKKYTIEAPSKRKYHLDGTLSKAEVMLISPITKLSDDYIRRTHVKYVFLQTDSKILRL